MDPVSAIGFAAAVLQFADFGAQVVSKAREISRSSTGRTALEAGLLASVGDLDRLSQGAKQVLQDTQQLRTNDDLLQVFREIETFHSEFSGILQSVRDRGKERHALKAAISAQRNEDHVAKAEARLSLIRTRILSYALFSLW